MCQFMALGMFIDLSAITFANELSSQMSDKEKKPKLSRAALKNALKLYKYVRPYRGEFAVGMLFLFLSTAASLAFPELLGQLLDASDSSVVNTIALNLVYVLIIQAVASFFRVFFFVNVTEKSLAALRQATYQHLIKLPITFFNKRRVGELNSRISSDISMLQETFTTTLAEFIRQIIIIVGGVTILMYTSPTLTLFMLAVVPVAAIVAVIFGRFIRRFSKEVQKKVAESNTIVEETLQGIFNVKAFANEFFEIARYKKKTDAVAKVGMKGGIYRGAFSSFIVLGFFGAISAVVWKGANLRAVGELGGDELAAFVLYSIFIGASIGGLAGVYSRLQSSIGATEELIEIMEEPIEELSDQNNGTRVAKLKGAIGFDKVHFEYPTRKDLKVISDVNFTAHPGEQIAIVGPSGAGKSTLVSLLLRFYEPSKGEIQFDGLPASSYKLSELRNQMAVVPQDVFLFGGTIRENILYGKPGATDEEVMAAAKKANAWEFIEKFPEKLDTVVGERGVQLSGGQRQRVAIARAVLKDPCILILDEATSALDSESERLVQEALENLMEGRTSVVIAHRLSTVRKADRILVMEEGKIVETGTHSELMEIEDGIYQNLSTLQFTS